MSTLSNPFRVAPSPAGRVHAAAAANRAWSVWFLPTFLAVSLADLLLTRWLLVHHQGVEANPIAAAVLHLGGFTALGFYKLAIVAFVTLSCWTLFRASPRAGRRLAVAAVLLSAAPVLWSLHLLTAIQYYVIVERHAAAAFGG